MKKLVYKFFLVMLRFFPIKKNKILFCSYHGNAFSGNPRYIAESLVKNNKNFDIVWLGSRDFSLPDGMRSVKIKSINALYEYATSKIWIDDCRKPEWLVKRKKQYYIQTWHGGIGLKKCEGLATDTLPLDYIKSAKHDSKIADLFLSDSKWLTNLYRNAFWYSGKILEMGLPREDILYSSHEPFRKRLLNDFGLSDDTRFVLYAPTFRDTGDIKCYNIDYDRLIRTLESLTPYKWRVIIRLHPNLQSKQHLIQYNKNVLNGSKYSDINTLILGSSLFISDYSSCMFDATIAKVPVLLYASDIIEYTSKERGLFFSWDELPFEIAKNNEELNVAITTVFDEKYIEKGQKFMQKCGFINNKHSSDYIASIIINIINE